MKRRDGSGTGGATTHLLRCGHGRRHPRTRLLGRRLARHPALSRSFLSRPAQQQAPSRRKAQSARAGHRCCIARHPASRAAAARCRGRTSQAMGPRAGAGPGGTSRANHSPGRGTTDHRLRAPRRRRRMRQPRRGDLSRPPRRGAAFFTLPFAVADQPARRRLASQVSSSLLKRRASIGAVPMFSFSMTPMPPYRIATEPSCSITCRPGATG